MTVRRRLTIALALAAVVAALEFWGGFASRSLALTTDAVHVCTDVLALALALIAAIGAARPADRRRTFGYGRIEILGALLNGALLVGITIVIVYEAVLRFRAPVEPHGSLMTIVATIGFAVNLMIGLTLSHKHESDAHGHVHERDLNVRAALFHVVGDAMGALAVIVGGIIIALTHVAWIDPLLSLFVSGIIVVGVIRVIADAADIVLEAVPRGIDTAELEGAICNVEGVVAVHDLHVWSIASGSRALSAHVLLDDRRISEANAVLRSLQSRLQSDYAISHATVQFESEHCDPGGIVICIPTDPSPPSPASPSTSSG